MSSLDWLVLMLSYHGKCVIPHSNLNEARNSQISKHLVSLETKRRTSCIFNVRAATMAFQPLCRPCPPYTQPCPSLRTGRPRDSFDHVVHQKWEHPNRNGNATLACLDSFSLFFAERHQVHPPLETDSSEQLPNLLSSVRCHEARPMDNEFQWHKVHLKDWP